MSKKYNKVTFLDEGIYEGTISDVSVSETSDGKTTFVNVYITTVMDGEEIVLHKPFIENVGRNFALGKFVKDAGVMGKRGQEIVLHKPFIENVGRNFALGKFVKDAGVMGKRGQEIVLHKPFIENVGRNFALGKFVKDAGVMGKRGQVCYDDLIGLDVEFELTFNEKTYKPVLSNFEFFEFSEEDESEEEE